MGSLTCHVLRDTSKTIFNNFNATTSGLIFSSANTYDPYDFGRKRERLYNCDIFLTDANFDDLSVDLEVVLILQPLIRRRGGNRCDAPIITRTTVRIEFEGYGKTTPQSFIFTTILRRTSFKVEKVSTTTIATPSTPR